jgi:hypothetical protein
MVVHASIDTRDRFGHYSIQLAVPDDDGLKPLKIACGVAYITKFGKKATATAVMPYKAPDDIDADLAGTVLASAKSKLKPMLFDRNRQPVADGVLMRGDRVMASVTPFAWSRDGRTGVTLQVRGIMLVERGAGAVTDADQDFEGVEVPEAAIESEAGGEPDDDQDVDDGDASGDEF